MELPDYHPGGAMTRTNLRWGWSGVLLLLALTATTSGAGTLVSAAASERNVQANAHGDAPFAVGTTTERFVDTSRPTPSNGTYPGSPVRTIKTLILYPAKGASG